VLSIKTTASCRKGGDFRQRPREVRSKSQGHLLFRAEMSTHENSHEEDDGDIDPFEKDYIVERILRVRDQHGSLEYLIKWKGYSDEYNTWEPASNLTCNEILSEFMSSRPKFFENFIRKYFKPKLNPSESDDDEEDEYDIHDSMKPIKVRITRETLNNSSPVKSK